MTWDLQWQVEIENGRYLAADNYMDSECRSILGRKTFDTYEEAEAAIKEYVPDGLDDGSTPRPSYFEPLFRAPDGNPIHFVNVYRVGQGYGGPEEGGWWFTCGEPEASVPCYSREQAEEVREQLREQFPDTHKRYSVLGGDDYEVSIEDHPAKAFPEEMPYYE